MRRLLLLLACAALASWADTGQAAGKVVARVGQATITERQVVSRVMALIPSVRFHRKFSKTLMSKLRKIALAQLVDEELLYQHAIKLKLQPTDQEIHKAKAHQVAAAGGAKRFAEQLKRLHMGWPAHWRRLKRQLAIRALLRQQVIAPSSLTQAQVKAHYQANRQRYMRPAEVKLGQMLFSFAPGAKAAAVNEAKARAAGVVSRLKAGADFAKLASGLQKQKRSHARGGDLGWVHKGRLALPLEAVAFSLKRGQYSQPIKTHEGYVVLKVYDIRPARQLTYEAIAVKLKRQLITREAKRRKEALVKRLRAGTTIHWPK